VLGATDKVKLGGEVTVSTADVRIPSDATVMVEVPAAIPVAKPVALMVAIAVLLLAKVRGASAMELPYWSFGVAVNCSLTPTSTDAVCGVSAIEEREGDVVFVDAAVGLPPQLTNKREITAIHARDISFRFFSKIAKLVAFGRTFLGLTSGEVQSRCQLQNCAWFEAAPARPMHDSPLAIHSSETT
jgi:hypothetical protein